MNHFAYRAGALYAEDVPLSRIADEVGTPTYVYSEATLARHYRVVDEALAGQPHLLAYSVKSNSNLAVLRLFAGWGAGFDIVSLGELMRVLQAGGDPKKVVFAGVGKTEDEMRAALKAGILLFNVESAEELTALDRVARSMGTRAPFALRVNPDVDPKTHRYIATGLRTSKFGVPFNEARSLYRRARKLSGLLPLGVDCHIGSQLTDTAPMRAAVTKVADFYRRLKAEGLPLAYLDVGGGLGITYRDERPPSPDQYAKVLRSATAGTDATLVLEPGRVLVGNAGLLLTRLLYRKKTRDKHFLFVDAGMNDLLRPALYEAHHQILPVRRAKGRPQTVDLAGPVCESSDVLARSRRLVVPKPGALFAVMSAGAYGMSMASNYNSRPRPAEVLVSGDRFRVVRQRESFEDLWRTEG